MILKKTTGMYETFDRSGCPTRSTHYCAGCGHGIIHKLILETMFDLGLQDRMIIISPIGCSVFGYYYWDCGNMGAAHGRAPSAGTGIIRARPDALVALYQGDGDLGAIGFNHTFQAASRGERMAVFFVNNAAYGMTGGQMAPTTLIGAKTMTTPYGRDPLTEGYPLHICEVLNQLKAPVYIERVSVADTRRIMRARRAVRKALEIQRDGKGYAFVEFISPCPTTMGLDPVPCANYCIEEMEKEFPLGCLRDNSATAKAVHDTREYQTVESFFKIAQRDEAPAEVVDETVRERHLKFAGLGGQGILSLGICVAEAARLERRYTTWYPTYGPEQRGGSAACSVVISGTPIGSPVVDFPDVMICMNKPSYERFLKDMRPGGTVFVDRSIPLTTEKPENVRVVHVPAIDLSNTLESPKSANTVMLAALAFTGVTGLRQENLLASLDAGLKRKPGLMEINRHVFQVALEWMRDNHGQ